MRDPFDAISVVLARIHEPQVLKPEVLHRPYDVRDVHEILGLL
jgi:hypothetical protein